MSSFLPTKAQARLQALTTSLTTPTTSMASSPITCHVLNTLSGTPAAGLNATLTLLAPTNAGATQAASAVGPQPVLSFHARTDADGRVKIWQPSGSEQQSVHDLLENYKQGEKVPFSIKFDVGPWYESQGVESFWPEVEVKFYVKKGERHYHVPVLVGPWTYTTYRGS